MPKTGSTTRKTRGNTRLLTLSGLTAILLAGCGGSGGDDGIASLGNDRPEPVPTGDASGKPTNPEDALIEFRRCMQEQGAPVDDGGGVSARDENQVTDENVEAAGRACKHLLEGSGVTFSAGGAGEALSGEQLEGLVQYAKCMRANGIDMPDPDPDSGGIFAGGDGANVDPNSDEYKRAHSACEDKLPGNVEESNR